MKFMKIDILNNYNISAGLHTHTNTQQTHANTHNPHGFPIATVEKGAESVGSEEMMPVGKVHFVM